MRRITAVMIAAGLLLLCGIPRTSAQPPSRQARAAAPIVLGFIGDSITHNTPHGATLNPPQAVAADLRTWLANPHVTEIDAARPGARTYDWLPSLRSYFYQTTRAYFTRDHVQWVLIMLGANDARRVYRVSPAAYLANMRAISSDLVAHGFKVLVNVPLYSQPGGLHGEIDEYSTRLEQLYSRELPSLAKRGHVFMGDTVAYPYFAVHPEQTVDGVHPNAAGVAALAQMWAVAYLRAAGVR